MSNIYGRQVVVPLTNKSGGSVIAGDVVVVDTGNNEAFTTSTAGGVTSGVGIAQETIANNASGRVLMEGYAALVNTSASVTRGNYGKTHTVAKQAVDAGASRTVGTFCQFLTGGTTPTARVYPPDLNASSGNVATDAIWDAKGDLAVGTGADTAQKLTVGTNGFVPIADSSQTTGIKWGTPPGMLLAVTRYAPSSQTIISITSTSMADADANLTVTFTAPASGNIVVVLSAFADITANAEFYWGLRESSSDISGSIARILRNVNDDAFISTRVYLTGISAGSHTYKWSAGVASTTTGRIIVQDGSAIGKWAPALMEVYAA